MKLSVALCFLLLAGAPSLLVSATSETCDTTTVDVDARVDCFSSTVESEDECTAAGCLWCPLTDGSSQPWCFYPGDYTDSSDDSSGETCSNTPVSTDERVDCYSGSVDSESSCISAGCLWCPLSDGSSEPWCFYPSTNPLSGLSSDSSEDSDSTTDSSSVESGESGETTETCDTTNVTVSERIDCYSSSVNSESTCISAGCLWCPLDDGSSYPWCFYPSTYSGYYGGGGSSGGGGGSEDCDIGIDRDERIDCGEMGSTEDTCIAAGCFWCPLEDGSTDPWCYYNSTGWPTGYGRVDCYPEGGETEDLCSARGCEYGPSGLRDAPWCYFPENYGYTLTSLENGTNYYRATLSRVDTPSIYGSEYDTIYADFYLQADYRLRVKIWDGSGDRYEVPITINDPASSISSDPLYELQFSTDPVFSFQVVRRSTGTVVFDTSFGGLTFSDQFLEIATYTPSTYVYGFGENEQSTYLHTMQYETYAFYGRDQPPAGSVNMYGTQPHYTCLEEDGNAHSVIYVNSNAQEVNLTPDPGVIYRTIGGILDVYIFLGPTPEDAVSQYTEAVGRFSIPPYWALGFQISRYGYSNTAEIQAVVERTAAAGIPQDVQFGDIDVMEEQLDFTISSENFADLPSYVISLKSQGIKFITILDPCISTGEPSGSYRPFDLGEEMSVWVMRSDGVTPVVASVWPDDPVYFGDFTSDNAKEWWQTLITEFHDTIEYDGLWIDMNEPANFVAGDLDEGCAANSLNNPPYVPAIADSSLYSKTICPDHIQAAGLHYNVHNIYGWSQTEPTLLGVRAGTGKRGIVLTRSNFLGSGKWAAHWLGDNYSTYDNMKHSIIGMLQYNMFGVPMCGADICGFQSNSDADLCQRWQEVGAFYPFSRNHNNKGSTEQDPAVWGDAVAASSAASLLIRYNILPYYYTLFYEHYTHGTTVARALWHEFPTDEYSRHVDQQFLIGPAFLVSPVLEEDAVSVSAYFPTASRWYNYYDGSEIAGGNLTLDADMSYIPLHVRGGYVIPTQDPATHTSDSRLNNFGLIVALDTTYTASGSLYNDDGESQDTYENGEYFLASISVSDNTITFTVENDGYSGQSSLQFGTVIVMGTSGSVSSVTVNSASTSDFTYDSTTKQLTISNIGVAANSDFTVSWS